MASSPYSVTTEGEEALAASTLETLVQIRGHAGAKTAIVEWGVGLDATAAGTALAGLARQTTDGTGSAASEVPWDADDPAASFTGFHSFSAEPTTGDYLAQYEVPENGGQIIMQYPLGREIIVDSATTARVGLVVTATQTCNAVAYLVAA
jgi:hypothetical protein